MDFLSSYFLLSISFLLFIIQILRRKPNLPPSPWAIPVIGHLHHIKDVLYVSLTQLASVHGPIYYLRFGCKSFVVVSSPSTIEECVTINDVVLANRPKSMAGDILLFNFTEFAFAPYGHYWRVMRRLCANEMFSSSRLQQLMGLRMEEVSVIVRALARACDDGNFKRVDLTYLSSLYNFNHMARIQFGKRYVDEEDVWSKVGKENVSRIKGVFFSSVGSGMCDFFPVLRLIGYKGLEKQLKSLFMERVKFLNELMDEAKGRKNDSGAGGSMYENMLSLQASDPEFYTNDVIKSTITVMFSAGTESSAVVMEWAMAHMLTNPHLLHKLSEEIDANVGHTRLISDSDLANLPYLQCVVNETLRLHPPAPLLLPHCASEECTIGGYTVPKNTTLIVNAWGVHRDPNIWDDPLKFKPERFLGKDLENEGYKFIPFGKGRRACPGAGMGMRVVTLALGAFIQCFEWKKITEEVNMEDDFSSNFILQKLKPLEAMCKTRDEAAHLLSQL